MSKPLSFRLSRITGLLLVLVLVIGTGGCNLGDGSSTPTASTSLYVSPIKNTVNDCLSPATACQTINTALAKALDGYTIFVAPGTYPEQLKIYQNITLKGTGAQPSEVVIDGQNKYQVVAVGCMACTKAISVSNLTIQNGLAPSSGGYTGAAGVSVTGATLTMSQVIIQNNVSGPGTLGLGGGIYVSTTSALILSDATVSGNSTSNNGTNGEMYNGKGGGIYNMGSLTITGKVTLSNNSAQISGGGLYNAKGSHASISGANILNNQAEGATGDVGGGGIYSAGELLVQGGTTIKNNQAYDGGGLHSTGVTTLKDAIFDGNTASEGGGIYQNYGEPTTRLTATNLSIVNNQAGLGGGIANNFMAGSNVIPQLKYLQIEQSTIANNHAVYTGGGMINWNHASMYLVNDTLSSNTAGAAGGGIATGAAEANGLALNVTIAYNTAPQGAGIFSGGGSFALQNVLLAKNTGQNCMNSNGGTITSNAGNLSSDNSCNLSGPLDKNNLDPKIGLLADNGGTTQTIALGAGSPAIDTGLQFLAPQIDQRGLTRGGDGNGDGISGYDIGAFEVMPNTQGMNLQITQALVKTTQPVVTNTPTLVVTNSPTPTWIGSVFIPNQNPPCREGPAVFYRNLGIAQKNSEYLILGQNKDRNWFYIQLSDSIRCWVISIAGSGGDTSGVVVIPVKDITLTPTLTFTPVPPAAAGCGSYSSADTCNVHPGCGWVVPPTGGPGSCN